MVNEDGGLIGINVFDYLILSESEYLSFAEEGIVEELNMGNKKQQKKTIAPTKTKKRKSIIS